MGHSKLLCTVVGLAGAIVLISSGSVLARNFSISSSTFRQVYRSFEFESEGIETIRCPVTMEGSMHARTFAKVERALIGYINRAVSNEGACTGGGRLTFLPESLPWHLINRGFEGSLPQISRHIRGAIGQGSIIRTVKNGVVCDYRIIDNSNGATARLNRNTTSGQITEMRFTAAVMLVAGDPLVCPWIGPNNIRGEGTETVPGTSTLITLTLI